MPIIWELLTDGTRDKLRRYQRRKFNQDLVEPHIRQLPVKVIGKIEDLEEIDRLMRKPPAPPTEGD